MKSVTYEMSVRFLHILIVRIKNKTGSKKMKHLKHFFISAFIMTTGFYAQSFYQEEPLANIKVSANEEGQWVLDIFNNKKNQFILDLFYKYTDEEKDVYVLEADQKELRSRTTKAIKKVTGYKWRDIDAHAEVKQAVKEQLLKRADIVREEAERRASRLERAKDDGFLYSLFKSAMPVDQAIEKGLNSVNRIEYCLQYGEIDQEFCGVTEEDTQA